MGRITALRAAGRQSTRVHVALDDGETLELTASLVAEAGLEVGQELAAEKRELFVMREAELAARCRALRFLELRERCSREVELRLTRYGYTEETATAVVGWLVQLGLVDDARFGRAYVKEKTRVGWGRRRIRSELVRKGLDQTAIDTAFDEVAAEPDSTDRLLVDLVRRRFRGEFASDPTLAHRRAAAFLARRGHDSEVIGRVLRAAAPGSSQGDGDQPCSS